MVKLSRTTFTLASFLPFFASAAFLSAVLTTGLLTVLAAGLTVAFFFAVAVFGSGFLGAASGFAAAALGASAFMITP
uniref:Uncharacterized protein n=1 Tax=mine drainage metagenome TaxID=410659 RepID=E6QNI5_9ZZZZ